MPAAKDQSPLGWAVAIREVGKQALLREWQATAAERAALAAALGLVQVDALSATCEITPLSRGRYRLNGRIEAMLRQRCVVTLEPVEALVQDSFEVEFRPPDGLPRTAARGDEEALAAPDIEPIANATIDVGRIVFETLACALDPYPRKSDALLDWHDPEPSDQASEFNPLAAPKEPRQG